MSGRKTCKIKLLRLCICEERKLRVQKSNKNKQKIKKNLSLLEEKLLFFSQWKSWPGCLKCSLIYSYYTYFHFTILHFLSLSLKSISHLTWFLMVKTAYSKLQCKENYYEQKEFSVDVVGQNFPSLKFFTLGMGRGLVGLVSI